MPAKFNNYKGGNKRGRDEDGGADMPLAWEVANVAVRRLPKNCRGLVHIAIVVGYTGTAFRGLQLQTHEHISHTIEGTLLCALFDAGYLLPGDFEGGSGPHKGGTKLDSSSGISVEVQRTVTTTSDLTAGEVGDSVTTEGDASTPTTAALVGEGVPSTATSTTITETQLNTAANFRFARSCRTDKGVHAVRNVVSMFLRDSDWRRDGNDGMRSRINSMIPPTNTLPSSSSTICSGGKVMEVLSIAPVLPAFNPRDACSGRVYRYLLPMYALGLSGACTPTTTPSPSDQRGQESRLQSTIHQHIIDAMGTCSSGRCDTDRHVSGGATGCSRCAGLYNLAELCKGASIDSWDTLYNSPAYASDPLLQEMRKAPSQTTTTSESSSSSSVSGGSILQPLPLSPSMCVGVASDIAGTISSLPQTSFVSPSPTATPLTEELSLIISYANTYLYDQYCSSEGRAAKRFHNFSLNRLDGGGGGGESGGGSKQLTGTDNEAPRSLSRCELAPYVAWLPNPRYNNTSSPTTNTSAFKWLNKLGGGTVIPSEAKGKCHSTTSVYSVDGDDDGGFFMNTQEALSTESCSLKSSSTDQPRMLPFLVFQVEGRSFLLHMIRKMVGTLLAVLRQGKSWWLPRQVNNNIKTIAPTRYSIPKADVDRVSELVEAVIKGSAAATSTTESTTTLSSTPAVTLCPTPSATLSISKDSLQAITAGERVIRESLLSALMDANTLASVPMAPGPYLTQMFASYHNYDCMMRTVIGGHKKKMEKLRKFNEYKASQREKQISGGVAEVLDTQDTTTNPTKGIKKGTHKSEEEDDDDGGDADLVPPYYLAYSHMLQDVFTKPPAVLDQATVERLSWTANLKVPVGDSSATHNSANTNNWYVAAVLEADEPISSNFYWRVVASEIALVDSGVYLSNDTDALLMLRDLCSILLRSDGNNDPEKVAHKARSLVSSVKGILRAALARSTKTKDTTDVEESSSNECHDDTSLLDEAIAVAPTVFIPPPTLLTTDSVTSSDVNTARRLLAFINRSNNGLDSHTSHMTQFLRGLRVHDWRTTPPQPAAVTQPSIHLEAATDTSPEANSTKSAEVKLTKGQRKEQWRIREYEEHRATIRESYLKPLATTINSFEVSSVLDRIFDEEVSKMASNNATPLSEGVGEEFAEGEGQLREEGVVTCSGADGWLYWGLNPHQQAAHRILTQRTMNKISDCFLKSAAQSRDAYHTTTSSGAPLAATNE